MDQQPTLIAFAGDTKIAQGTLRDLLPTLKARFDHDPSDLVLTFEVETGRPRDFDLRGTWDEVLARHGLASPPGQLAPGRGRPKLGVTSREITLLPRHWDWLDHQRGGGSAALRRLVDQAIEREPGPDRARRIRAALSGFLTAMAGNRPGFEEASRAWFAADEARLRALIAPWPQDIQDFILARSSAAAEAEQSAAPSASPD